MTKINLHTHTHSHTHNSQPTHTLAHAHVHALAHTYTHIHIILYAHDAYFTDLLFVSHPNLVFNTNVTVPFSTSDHATIECDIIVCKCATCSSHEIPLVHDLDFHRTDHVGFTNEIIHTD